jgi:glycerol-3-phosphate dehydrogenase (NAD(P)+)
MAIITIIGAGVMGAALSVPLSDNGHEVRLVGTPLDTAIIQSCLANGYHPKLRRQLPAQNQYFSHEALGQAMQGANVVVIGVNSRGVHWAAEAIGPHLAAGQVLLMITKGLESGPQHEIIILPDVLHSRLPAPARDSVYYAAIGGPSIAGELAAKRHTSVVFVSRDASILPMLQQLFATPYYHIWTSTDMLGVELCVALKNPYAMAVGLAAGVLEQSRPDEAKAQNHNYAAAIFAQGLAEMSYLVQKMGGNPQTIFSLPGAGDLYVTTQGGRNSRMGRLLGMGKVFSDAVEEMPGETVEGVDAVIALMPAIEGQIAAGQLSPEALPLLLTLHKIITRNSPAEFEFKRFFATLGFAQA